MLLHVVHSSFLRQRLFNKTGSVHRQSSCILHLGSKVTSLQVVAGYQHLDKELQFWSAHCNMCMQCLDSGSSSLNEAFWAGRDIGYNNDRSQPRLLP